MVDHRWGIERTICLHREQTWVKFRMALGPKCDSSGTGSGREYVKISRNTSSGNRSADMGIRRERARNARVCRRPSPRDKNSWPLPAHFPFQSSGNTPHGCVRVQCARSSPVGTPVNTGLLAHIHGTRQMRWQMRTCILCVVWRNTRIESNRT